MSALTGLSQISSVTQTTTDSITKDNEANTESPPKPSEAAVDFLERIEEDDFKHVLFQDNLVTVSDAGTELGEFTIDIKQARHQGIECFLVHANSHGAIDNVPCGTSITTYVSQKLETLEQNHHEYVKLENHPLDRKTIISRQEDEYVINRVITQGDDVQRSSRSIMLENMKGFISEGSNLLLQRILVKKNLPQDFQLISLDSDANLCSVVYKSLGDRTQVVQQTEIDVTGIERTINSVSDLPTTWQSYFARDGHLTSRVQVGSPVTMRLLVAPSQVEEDLLIVKNPIDKHHTLVFLPTTYEEQRKDEESPKPTFGKQQLNWEEDVQMYSKFLDRKEELKNDHSVYMRQHPELRALMADFLQFLLLRKPDDVIAFAATYFSSFSSRMPGTTAYAESGISSPFPNIRSNSKIEHLSKAR